jgi:site-specific DNA-methyltransferase (adenine-specific)
VWVKTNPMPSLTGDRPGMGWEAMVYLHRDDVPSSWNGGGKCANYVGPTSQGSGHPTQKPEPLIRSWVLNFTNPGDVILDPFAGSGTTLRMAKDEGRRAVGYESREEFCELTANRLTQEVLFA